MLNLYVLFMIALNFPSPARRHLHSISVTSTAHTLFFIWLANEEEFLWYYTSCFKISLSEFPILADTSKIQPKVFSALREFPA